VEEDSIAATTALGVAFVVAMICRNRKCCYLGTKETVVVLWMVVIG